MPPALPPQAKAPTAIFDLGRANDAPPAGRTCDDLLERFVGRAHFSAAGTALPAIRPVEFEACTWMAFAADGRLVLQFEVHGDKFVRVRLARDAQKSLLCAIRDVLDAVPTVSARRPAGRRKNRKPMRRLNDSEVVAAREQIIETGCSVAVAARALGCSTEQLRHRFLRDFGKDYCTAFARERAARAPLLKPNGKLL